MADVHGGAVHCASMDYSKPLHLHHVDIVEQLMFMHSVEAAAAAAAG
jgi:hypothetical protein